MADEELHSLPIPARLAPPGPVDDRIPLPAAEAHIRTRPALPGDDFRVEDPPKENEQEQLPRALTTGRNPP